jgi:hypothetical protein
MFVATYLLNIRPVVHRVAQSNTQITIRNDGKTNVQIIVPFSIPTTLTPGAFLDIRHDYKNPPKISYQHVHSFEITIQ